MANWFEDTFGFPEPTEYAAARARFRVEGEGDDAVLLSQAPSGKKRLFHLGMFEMPSVSELRSRLANSSGSAPSGERGVSFSHASGDVRVLHRNPAYAGTVFQAASQFNCLEMVGPNVRPEDGVTRYWMDRTQGPICAMACPAATVFRNYLVDGTGQAGAGQLDLLRGVGRVLGNHSDNGGAPRYWTMENGYCAPRSPTSMAELNAAAETSADPAALREAAIGALQVGVHWSTEVTLQRGESHRVCQVFSSALPLAYYKSVRSIDWEPLAKIVLDATYEATFAAAALLARRRAARVSLVLTKVGGGAFGNRTQWIVDSIARAVGIFREHPLDVTLLHYGHEESAYVKALKPFKAAEN
jgi:hypothetical protein